MKKVKTKILEKITIPLVKMISGGCSAFGHSCFGGHGKRSDGGGGEQMPPELPALETLVFPAGDVYQPLLPPRGDPLVRRALALEKMPPALRQWVRQCFLLVIFKSYLKCMNSKNIIK
jgi:hypothetical protein